MFKPVAKKSENINYLRDGIDSSYRNKINHNNRLQFSSIAVKYKISGKRPGISIKKKQGKSG